MLGDMTTVILVRVDDVMPLTRAFKSNSRND